MSEPSRRKPLKILLAKPGLDGHDRGIQIVAAALKEAGMEILYLGLQQTPEQIVEAAEKEGADVIAISVHSGAHMTVFPKVMKLLKQKKLTHLLVTGGGIIPKTDQKKLASTLPQIVCQPYKVFWYNPPRLVQVITPGIQIERATNFLASS